MVVWRVAPFACRFAVALMSLFRKKKRDDVPRVESDGPPEGEESTGGGAPPTFDEVVSPFYAAGDWDGLIKALDGIDPASLDESEVIRWYTGRGTAAERMGRRDEAVSAYKEGLRRHPDSSVMHCIVGRLLEEEGRFDEALPHFRSVRLDGGGQAVVMAARYCNLWDAFEDSAALYSQIFSAYFDLKIADDHFLYTRGLPFFSQAYRALAGVLVLSGRGDEARALLDDSEARLSDLQGTENERLTLEATLGEPAGLLEHLSRAARSDGLEAMRLATWRARGTGQPAEAKQLLESVTLGEHDRSWLEDIRLLALIGAARRARELQRGDPRVSEFFEHQPTLFEPEHVFHFGLLDEQQAMKVLYRERRRELGPPSRGGG
jgi:tetratricopeptide (TPR) repeat protein